MKYWLHPGGLVAKNPPASAGDGGDLGSIPGLGRSHGGGHSNSLRHSCLENPMDRGPWGATVHGVTMSQLQLSDWASTHVRKYPENRWAVSGFGCCFVSSSVYWMATMSQVLSWALGHHHGLTQRALTCNELEVSRARRQRVQVPSQPGQVSSPHLCDFTTSSPGSLSSVDFWAPDSLRPAASDDLTEPWFASL